MKPTGCTLPPRPSALPGPAGLLGDTKTHWVPVSFLCVGERSQRYGHRVRKRGHMENAVGDDASILKPFGEALQSSALQERTMVIGKTVSTILLDEMFI